MYTKDIKMGFNMVGVERRTTIFLLLCLVIADLVNCEVYVYPGLRRKPPQSLINSQLDYPPDFLTQLVEDHARRKLHHQFEQQLEAIHQQINQNRQHQNLLQYEPLNPIVENEFTYDFPKPDPKEADQSGPISFAVNPSDQRYFIDDPNNADRISSEDNIANEEKPWAEMMANSRPDMFAFFKPKGSSVGDVGPMKPVQNAAVSNGVRKDIDFLVQKLEKESNSRPDVVERVRNVDDSVIVRQQNMGIEAGMGMYVVALIAGISAAVTVGLIALGVAWYTLQKKTKAASDVEYPAYGITGPNKGSSPSFDSRLAQSAQMYHYQHQKQQIIAMENSQVTNDSIGRLSDVESDDDNEEGDYTVYECPGLAPTNEMEVKNPLFLDDTPITPSIASHPTEPDFDSHPSQKQKAGNHQTGKSPAKTTENSSSFKKNAHK